MKDKKEIVRQQSSLVNEAKKNLKEILRDGEELHFKGITYENSYPRYHFYKESNKRVIYTILSKEEIEEFGELETFAV